MKKPTVWLLQASENLPIDHDIRLLRTGIVADEFLRRGYEVVWFASRFQHSKKKLRTGVADEIQLAPGYRLVLLPGPGYTSNISLRRIWHNSLVAKAFLQYASRYPVPDVIISSYPSPELCSAAAWYARKRKVPLFYDVRDSWPDTFERYLTGPKRLAARALTAYYRLHLRYAFSRADGVLAMGRDMQAWALGYAGRTKAKWDAVFHLGAAAVPEVPLSKGAVTTFTKEHPLRCVFVASFGYSYDGHMIVNAARELSQRGVEHIEIVMVGDGEFRAAWEAGAEGLKNIRFTGWLSRAAVTAELLHAHVGIAAYRGGILDFALPNKFFDYLSFGMVLASTIPNEGREILEANRLGVYVAPGDAAGLAHALSDLAGDPAKLSEMMRRAHATFEREFRADVIYRNYVAMIEEFLNGRPAAATNSTGTPEGGPAPRMRDAG